MYSPGVLVSSRRVMNDKFGDCVDLANLGRITLTKAGYNVFGRHLGKIQVPNDHVILVIKLKNGVYYSAVDFSPNGNHMRGPYKTLLELERALGYGSYYKSREPFLFLSVQRRWPA